jgi:hypothetical protein
MRATGKPSPLKNPTSASGSLATLLSYTILPLASTMHTLDNFKDTSIPACCSIPVLRSRCRGRINRTPELTTTKTHTASLLAKPSPLNINLSSDRFSMFNKKVGHPLLATSFPTEYQVQLRELVRRYIADVVAQEWPMMARGTANLRAIPGVLAEALQATLALNPSSEGQKTAQRDIATALETALDARRQRIIISESQVNLLKWVCLFMQAVCTLLPLP